ncbi:MAG: TonB-dependent receptor, partial [Phaeodactylibacter sp.]|nr:TonB-dependent receptor [Phaeodactylibacter sp.]
SRALYSYAESAIDSTNSLPYNFTDLYGKLSFLTGNGSKLNVFGFNFRDQINFSVADLSWLSTGVGADFTVIPPSSNFIFGGTVAFSDYDIELIEQDGNPRQSSISNVSAQLDFTYFGGSSELNYGFKFNGISTDFTFRNFLGNTIEQLDFTTELAGFLVYKQKLGNVILEPSLRMQFYPSQGATSIEPRFGAKWNITDFLRFKAAGGLYSQNLLSSTNESDVVSLFVGFLTGPEESIKLPGSNEIASNRLQTAAHAVAGFEVDLTSQLEFNVEGYYKDFTQLIFVNRNKLSQSDPDYAAETGDAYGVDFSLRYENNKGLYLWGTYSHGYVNRNDGEEEFPTVFDRRHNVNLLGTYTFGEKDAWELGVRWNYGSPFPFTQTQGFFSLINFIEQGLGTDPLTTNPPLGVIFADERNGGRLVPYHRLDASLKRTIFFGEYTSLEILASVTNVYNRSNIFFIDRKTADRVDQLPILPSLGITLNL